MKEGDLLKVCNGGPRRYKFVLFSDMLVYGTETIRAKLQKDHLKYKVTVHADRNMFFVVPGTLPPQTGPGQTGVSS